MRPICPSCNERPIAINRKIGDKTYYRRQCDACLRKGKRLKPIPPNWYQKGYRKKPTCERCGFEAELPDKQLHVFHVDGNLKNTDRMNLKTICLNCQPLVYKSRLPWKASDAIAGF
jgi:hypothetical protein